jgi:hypothetical protein
MAGVYVYCVAQIFELALIPYCMYIQEPGTCPRAHNDTRVLTCTVTLSVSYVEVVVVGLSYLHETG